MHPRCLRKRLERALGRYPVVVLLGPRRVGKSTLARRLARPRGMGFLSLGDPSRYEEAKAGVDAFLRSLRLPAAIDAVERLPTLFHAVRRRIRKLPPGALLLVGSGRPHALARLVEAYPDRVAVLTLDPFTRAELAGACFDLFRVLEDPPNGPPPESWQRAFQAGGMPEVQGLPPRDRRAWWQAYLAAGDRIGALAKLRPLLAHLAEEAPLLLNKSALGERVGHSHPWIREALERVLARGWVLTLPAWAPESAKKFLKQPRLLPFDSGFAHYLMGSKPLTPRHRAFRAFVLLELLRHANFAGYSARHLQSYKGKKLDLLLERPDGKLLAFAIQATADPKARDLADLAWFRDRFGERLAAGYLVHQGAEPRVLEGFLAVPYRVLWP